MVGNALHNVIEEVNAKQKYLELRVSLAVGYEIKNILDRELRPILQEAWKAIKLMDSFDIEYDFKTNRYNSNRATLKDMCEQMGVSTSTYTPRPTSRPISRPTSQPYHTTTSTNTTTSSNSGCMIWIVLALTMGALISCI